MCVYVCAMYQCRFESYSPAAPSSCRLLPQHAADGLEGGELMCSRNFRCNAQASTPMKYHCIFPKAMFISAVFNNFIILWSYMAMFVNIASTFFLNTCMHM